MGKFELLEHGADYGVRGTGKNLEEAFAECARGMFSIMVKDLKTVRVNEEYPIMVTAKTEEDLLLAWLNELLYVSHVKNFLFSCFKLNIEKVENMWIAKGFALGEKRNPKKHEMPLEVKGASYTGLKVEKKGNEFMAQCVVDV